MRALPPWVVPLGLWLPLVAALALAPAWTPEGVLGPPLETAALGLATWLAALGRPSGTGQLGLGTLALLPAFERLGGVPASLVAMAAALGAEALRRWAEALWREAPLPERRRASRVVTQAALAGLGALAAAAVWIGFRAALREREGALLALAAALAGLAYVVPGAAFEVASRRFWRDERGRTVLEGLTPFAWELPGFALGALVLAVARSAGWSLAAGWLAAATLLAVEAARRELGAEAARRSLAAAARLSRAGAALVAGGSELARLARRIFTECAAILPYAYAHLDLASPESGEVSFWSEPDGEPRPGAPDPPAYPPPLPGFHRREPWRIFDHRLLAGADRSARLRLWCDQRRLEASAEASLASLVPQMGASVRGALLDREATIDRLTGAATRRALERRLTGAFAACQAEGRPLALALCDLDHFKRINDTFGHAAGDRALQAAARVLLGPNRGNDFCARFGGEEFVLVLEGTSGADALEIAERLRRRVEALELADGGRPVPLTMSFGVAASPELPVRSAEELLELADGALYTAKRLGRNLALLDLGAGRMRTGAGGLVEVAESPPTRTPVFFA